MDFSSSQRKLSNGMAEGTFAIGNSKIHAINEFGLLIMS
ncbi:hypothetical protein Nos7524_2121 [Nostoc sp. PCC 7524]|nr:hypothetical protein Nos7524_2121 [Nostoc sp. PCC 7524]